MSCDLRVMCLWFDFLSSSDVASCEVICGTTPVLLCTTKNYNYYSSTTPTYYSSTTLYYKVLLQCYSVLQSTTPGLLCTTKYYSSTTLYYKVLFQYYSVLQSITPVLLCTTQYYSSTTLYYKVLQSTTPVLVQYYKVLRQYYSVLQSTIPVLLSTTKYYASTTLYYKVLLQYYSVLQSTTPVLLLYYPVLQRTTLYYKVLRQYYSSTTLYYSALQSTTPELLCTTKYYSSTTLYYKVLRQYYSVLRQYYNVLLRYYFETSFTMRGASKSHPPTSPTTAPATQNECHQWSASHMKPHFQYVEPSTDTLEPHQILRLPRKMNVINDVRHIWNVISNTWSKVRIAGTSPNTAPATQNECHQWYASHMKRHFQCVEQVKSPSNITKYCAWNEILKVKICAENPWSASANRKTIRP